MYRFLIDEDCPRSPAPALRQAGHDAVDVRDIGLRGASDDAVLERARQDARALITADTGIGNILRYPLASHSGVLVVRLPPTMVASMRVQMIAGAIADLRGTDLERTLVIIEIGRLRIRR